MRYGFVIHQPGIISVFDEGKCVAENGDQVVVFECVGDTGFKFVTIEVGVVAAVQISELIASSRMRYRSVLTTDLIVFQLETAKFITSDQQVVETQRNFILRQLAFEQFEQRHRQLA